MHKHLSSQMSFMKRIKNNESITTENLERVDFMINEFFRITMHSNSQN